MTGLTGKKRGKRGAVSFFAVAEAAKGKAPSDRKRREPDGTETHASV
jgi:hypothetical protein